MAQAMEIPIAKPESKIREYRNMVSAYITNISQSKEHKKAIRQLESIIGECHRKITDIEAELRK